LKIPARVVAKSLGTVSNQDLATKIIDAEQALCIVNTRAMAQDLFREIKSRLDPGDQSGLYHLSTWMCGMHRRQTLDEIKLRLKQSPAIPCRVISTQVVESGVDLDFPVVFRALAGLDSIAQASGRCNREGRSRLGHFYIFEPLDLKLRGTLGTAIENAKELLTADVDPLDPALVHKYFEMTYWKLGSELDKHRIFLGDHFIVEQLKSGVDVRFKFRAVARKFRMIDSSGSNFVVPYGTEGEYLAKKILNGDKLDREDWRKCQRYSVNVHLQTFETLIKSSSIFLKEDMPAVLINKDLYDEKIGLDITCEHPEYLPSEANVI
jgi:CRISPR-associated endonuclease/helicase Cas3